MAEYKSKYKGAAIDTRLDQVAAHEQSLVTVNENLTELGQNVGSIKTELDGDIDLSSYSKIKGAIDYQGKWDRTSAYYTHILIPIEEGVSYVITANSNYNCFYAWLTVNDDETLPDTPSFVSGTERKSTGGAGKFVTESAPSTAKYLYVNTADNSGNDYTPKSIVCKDNIKESITTAVSAEATLRTNADSAEETARKNADEINATAIEKNRAQIFDDTTPTGETTKEYTDVTPSVEDGYYINSKGVKTATDDFIIATIDLTSCDGVKVYGFQASAMSGLIFADDSGNYIADKEGNTYHVPSASGYNTIELDKPDGATKALVSFSTVSPRTYYCQTYDIIEVTEKTLKGKVVDHETRITNLENNSGLDIPEQTDVMMIPILGQSLSVGAAAYPCISSSAKYAAGIMFNGGLLAPQKAVSYFTSFQTLKEEDHITTSDSGETVSSGTCEKLLEMIQQEEGLSVNSTYWDKHKVLFVSCGAGSKTIAELVESYLDGFKNAIQGAKNICDAEGMTFSVPCWIWMQGETDQKSTNNTPKDTYKAALLSLATTINTYVKSVSGQTNDAKCICYQIGSQNIVGAPNTPYYTATAMDVPTAQMELIRDNDLFVASTPVYILTHSTEQPIHLSAIGEKMCGMYCGIAAKGIIFGDKPTTGLTPKSYAISGNTITIKYNVPCPPMTTDSTWVKNVDNYGFVVLNSANTKIISSVSVFDDEVTIVCSESPLNAKVFYGFNGTVSKDGRLEGSRGNLRDCAGYEHSGEIDGKLYALHNYAYSFAKVLDAESGDI